MVRNLNCFCFKKLEIGACVRLEQGLPGTLPVLYFACRRHKLERDLNAAFKAVFPDPSKAPTDALCEKVFNLAEEGRMPDQLDSRRSRYVFKSQSAFFRQQRERIAKVAEKMDKTGEKDGCLPRDDYRFLLNLVKVNMFLSHGHDTPHVSVSIRPSSHNIFKLQALA